MRKSVNFNHLEVFLSLAKTLSFSKTSIELGIAQPVVSRQIKTMEEQYQTQLFQRTRHSVSLTPYGEKLLLDTKSLYEQLCDKVENFKSESDDISGEISIGCLLEVGEQIFTDIFSSFKKAYPLIKLNLQFLSSRDIIKGVKSGSLHIGIMPEKLILESIRTYPILTEQIILVAGKDFKLKDREQILKRPFITYKENDPLLDIYLKTIYPKTQKSKLNIEFSVNSHKSMAKLLEQHNALAVLPSLSIREELRDGRLKEVGKKSIKTNLYLIHQDLEFIEKKTSTIIHYIREAVKDKF